MRRIKKNYWLSELPPFSTTFGLEIIFLDPSNKFQVIWIYVEICEYRKLDYGRLTNSHWDVIEFWPDAQKSWSSSSTTLGMTWHKPWFEKRSKSLDSNLIIIFFKFQIKLEMQKLKEVKNHKQNFLFSSFQWSHKLAQFMIKDCT